MVPIRTPGRIIVALHHACSCPLVLQRTGKSLGMPEPGPGPAAVARRLARRASHGHALRLRGIPRLCAAHPTLTTVRVRQRWQPLDHTHVLIAPTFTSTPAPGQTAHGLLTPGAGAGCARPTCLDLPPCPKLSVLKSASNPSNCGSVPVCRCSQALPDASSGRAPLRMLPP